MPAPVEPITIIDAALLARAVTSSRLSPRGRIILPLHKSSQSILQRMLNAVQPGSYIRPHRHSNPPKSESIIVLQGRITLVIFSDHGNVDRYYDLRAGTNRFGADLEPDMFHTFFATAADTVLYEAKTGPYDPGDDKDFAPWAPEEFSRQARDYLENLTKQTT